MTMMMSRSEAGIESFARMQFGENHLRRVEISGVRDGVIS